MREALLYKKVERRITHCYLCAHRCRIAEGKFGFCGVRQNIEGTLYTHVYAKPIAMHTDPIEKKPLYHFLPGSLSFSVATMGCNFSCGFCQNWEISQSKIEKDALRFPEPEVFPEEIVAGALKNNCKSISYTYTEPTIFFEYALDISRLAKEKSLYNIFVTNGYMTNECLEAINGHLSAANVDLKFFKDSSYRKVCGGSLEPVLNSIVNMKKMGVWVEVTTLVVPGENDSDEELSGIARFIAGVDKEMPWHISRFHPDYKFTTQTATPEVTLKKAAELGIKHGLNYVYVGNVPGLGNDTHCHECKKTVLKREGFSVLEYNIKEGKCSYCQAVIPGVF